MFVITSYLMISVSEAA